ncbi:MAG TPA: DUF4349 domain-containing protein, partial [Thermoanaerobaculia bacterium]|nr:DUF4349 domain-containing protein [Thermoanaerobaculia bacterium]
CKKSAEVAPAADEMIAAKRAPSAPAGPDALRSLGYGGQTAPADQARQAGQGEQAAAPRLPDAGRKLVKTVDLEMRVADTTGAAERLHQLAAGMGGYVSGMSADRRNDLLYYTLTLRVPVDRLEETLRKVKALAERVERESIRTEDVTERWIDLEARLTTLRATETELRQLLSEARQRQQKVEDIMAVYRQLVEIRTSIEQLQAEQQTLQGLTSLSTVNVQLVPTEAARPLVDEGWNPGGTLRQSFRTLLGALQSLVDIAIVLAVVVLPVALAILLPLWLLFRLWRRARRRGAAGEGG